MAGPADVTDQRLRDMDPATPRQRVSFNTATPLTLDGTWQPLPLGKNDQTFDVNTFPTNRHDATNNLILANPATTYEQGYLLSLDMAIKPNVTGYVVKPQLRFVVMAPTPVMFPLPASQKHIDLGYEITGTETVALHFEYPVYTNALIRQYGAQIQVNYVAAKQSTNLVTGLVTSLVQALTGTSRPQVLDATLNMYGL